MKSDREKALEDAAREFIAKVERGEARSSASYAAFKAALNTSERLATGVFQTEGDWPGIFIRGDDALSYAIHIENLYAKAEQRMDVEDAPFWVRLKELAGLLNSCRRSSR